MNSTDGKNPGWCKTVLRPPWRHWLFFLRLCRSRSRFNSPAGFLRWLWLALLCDPWLRKQRRTRLAKLELAGFFSPFFVRLGSSDLLCLLETVLEGEYDAVQSLLVENVRLVVDLGANVGYSIRLWQRQFPRAEIVAVEPDAGNLEICRLNVAAGENPDRVRLLQACVAGRSRKVALDRSGESWSYRMIDPGSVQGGVETVIDALTVDRILARHGVENRTIDLLKCDIEGAEAELFQQPGTWVNRIRCLAVETHGPYWVNRFLDDVARWGLTWEIHPEDETVFLSRQPGPVS